MFRFYNKISKKPGLKPGSLVHVGEKKLEQIQIRVIDYTETELTEKKLDSMEQCFSYKASSSITWIDITGLHDIEAIKTLGRYFDLHPLTLEDIVNTDHRPKLEEPGDYLFVVLKMLLIDHNTKSWYSEQVSVILLKNTVITFQEREGDVFEPVRERIRKTVPRVRFLDSDYLAYTLIDAVVDHYFLVLEQIGERIEVLEDILMDNPVPGNLQDLHEIKRELIFLRKSVWPLREVVSNLERVETSLIHNPTKVYLRDLYEHVIQVIDILESYRDMVSGLLDFYLSSVSNKMNEVMKILTIIATIFIPLGFVAGIYGMNFDTSISPFNLPELGWKYGYPFFWMLVISIGAGLFLFFKKRNWF